MDPNATYRQWWHAILAEDVTEAKETYNSLRAWIERGGFEPAWSDLARKQFFSFNPNTGRIE